MKSVNGKIKELLICNREALLQADASTREKKTEYVLTVS